MTNEELNKLIRIYVQEHIRSALIYSGSNFRDEFIKKIEFKDYSYEGEEWVYVTIDAVITPKLYNALKLVVKDIGLNEEDYQFKIGAIIKDSKPYVHIAIDYDFNRISAIVQERYSGL